MKNLVEFGLDGASRRYFYEDLHVQGNNGRLTELVCENSTTPEGIIDFISHLSLRLGISKL